MVFFVFSQAFLHSIYTHFLCTCPQAYNQANLYLIQLQTPLCEELLDRIGKIMLLILATTFVWQPTAIIRTAQTSSLNKFDEISNSIIPSVNLVVVYALKLQLYCLTKLLINIPYKLGQSSAKLGLSWGWLC